MPLRTQRPQSLPDSANLSTNLPQAYACISLWQPKPRLSVLCVPFVEHAILHLYDTTRPTTTDGLTTKRDKRDKGQRNRRQRKQGQIVTQETFQLQPTPTAKARIENSHQRHPPTTLVL
ncbi:hypothetical protein V495_08190 [Pseudogymnoascus sp. VKM F-4514 (FW-929)]|nr:hypothetical protein V495_08190 [Pseudogymnoascus sp. VKM F-4514 (FW-929)]